MPFKHNIGGGQQTRRRPFRLGDPVYDNGELMGGEGLRHTPKPYVSQFEFEVVRETSTGRIVEVFDTKTENCYYVAHAWLRADKQAFQVIGSGADLDEVRFLFKMWKEHLSEQTA
jgi:hypothetical protein